MPTSHMPLDPATSPAVRPLRSLSTAALISLFEETLAASDGWSGAHCIHEQWMRNAPGAHIDAALEALWKRAAATVPEWLPMRYISWLSTAYQCAAQFQNIPRGRCNIYLILLDYSDRDGDPHGVYVGMSKYSPAERFDQHKAGIRAARSVTRRGLEVLTGPALHLQHIKRGEAARIEEQLAELLRTAGLQVQGGH